MDLLLLCGIAISLLGTIISFYLFQKKRNAEIRELQNDQRNQNTLRGERLPNRTQIIRNQRNRLRNSTNTATSGIASGSQQRQQYDNDEDNENDELRNPKTGEKLGAKKRAKLEAKAEKRIQREAEIQLREEKKKKETALEEQRKIQEQKVEEEERKRAEAERLAKEEKEKKEHEEYLKMKENFSIEDEGCEEDPDDEAKMNLLQEFIQHIKNNKVVLLEDVASHFKIKTQQVIDRITELCENGTLTGVIDDRGKFIYISEEELNSIAKFIKQRGRVSILELVESSCDLINLNSINAVV